VIAPPGRRPRGTAEVEALFAEARRRRRRRRLAAGTACLLLAGLVAAGLTVWPRRGAVRSGAPAAGRAPGITLPPARVAWVDYGGQLHLGNLATRAQHVVATVDASAGDPMILAGGHLYWADTRKNVAPIRDYDIATGRIRYLARGDSVFASADGRHIYIVQTTTTLIELPAAGIGQPRRLTLPAGWHMSGDLGNWAVAGGIVVYSGPPGQRRHPTTLAVWTPETGRVKIIGRDLDITDTYTPRDASYSLLAWTSHGVLGITNTSSLASLTVRSPRRYGLTYGGPFSSGAFSPDGTRLAMFVNTTNPQDPYITPYSVLGIVNTRTGALRLARAACLVTTEDVGWARWLPAGNWLIAGAEAGSYAVNAVTLATRPLSFSGSPGQDIENSGDINFSATVLPYPRPIQADSHNARTSRHGHAISHGSLSLR
jgi:hypothetical protein